MRIPIILILTLCLTVAAKTGAAGQLTGTADSTKRIEGTIIRISGNTLRVEDILTRKIYRFFVHTNRLAGLKQGDHVRVSFMNDPLRLISVKKLTPLDCSEEQNLGYLSGCP